MSFTPELALLVGVIFGLAVGFFVAKKQYGNKHFDRDQLLEDKIRLEAEKNALSDSMARQKQDLAEMEKKFTLQFENLANRIFDEKSQKFTEQNKTQLDVLLKPLGDDRYLVYTRWASEEDFLGWMKSAQFSDAHARHAQRGPVDASSEVWKFEVLEREYGPAE